MMHNHANDSLVLGTVNASLPREVDADTLAATVRGDVDGARSRNRMGASAWSIISGMCGFGSTVSRNCLNGDSLIA